MQPAVKYLSHEEVTIIPDYRRRIKVTTREMNQENVRHNRSSSVYPADWHSDNLIGNNDIKLQVYIHRTLSRDLR